MNNPQADKSINTNTLPQEEAFVEKQVFQHKQPADTGKALTTDDLHEKKTTGKEANKSSSEEGLNAEKSEGDAGAFEGFENQGE